MHVLLIHRHFWPEQLTYALMLKDIACALVDAGHRVEVLSASSAGGMEGGQALDGVTVRRIRLFRARKDQWWRRAINTSWYLVRVGAKVATSSRPDVVMVATTPPVFAAAIVGMVCRVRGIPLVYHMQDLHPESAQASGVVKSGTVFDVLTRIDTATARGAKACVLLSRDMETSLRERKGSGRVRTAIQNNFVPSSAETLGHSDDAVAAQPSLPGSGVKVLFAGNLGLFQGLENVIEAMHRLGDDFDAVSLILLGDGAAKSRLEAQAGGLKGRSVHFLDRCSPQAATAYMRQADFGLVSLRRNVVKYAYPSKVMPYLAAGLPLLAVVEPESELARLIDTHQIGIHCVPAVPEALAECLREVGRAGTPDTADRQQRCKNVAAEEFGRQPALRRWVGLLEGVARG